MTKLPDKAGVDAVVERIIGKFKNPNHGKRCECKYCFYFSRWRTGRDNLRAILAELRRLVEEWEEGEHEGGYDSYFPGKNDGKNDGKKECACQLEQLLDKLEGGQP